MRADPNFGLNRSSEESVGNRLTKCQGRLLLLVGLLSVPLRLHAAADCDTVSFRPDGTFVTGGQPLHVATADLNRDNNLDFVLANAAGLVVVYYGDGTGHFTGPNNFAAGIYPHDVAVGDFNRDGFPDLAVAAGIDGVGSGVAIMLNNGDGTFSPPILYPAEGSPSQIVTADFNRDGKLDLAVTDNMSGNVDILLGTGTGTFGAPATFPATATPSGIVVGDFNGDHKLDLAIANYGSQDLRILHGDGMGGFTTIHTYLLSSNAGEVAAGDFNHDGHLDLAVTVYNIGSSDHISVYLGNGDGSFTAGQEIAVGGPQGIVAVDLNNDGNLDLATVTYSDNTVAVALGDGTGLFGSAQALAVPPKGVYPYDVTAGDFNHDGKQDLVMAGYLRGYAFVLINRSCR